MKYDPLLHVVLHQPEIPHNTGAIGRTCVAVGAKLWLVQPLGFQVDDRRLRRAGLDYWQHLEWEIVSDWPSLCERLAGVPRWLFTKHGRKRHCDARYRRQDALVFGSETQGLPASWLAESPESTIRIPCRQEVRSLNLASAAAIGIYEALRQISALENKNR